MDSKELPPPYSPVRDASPPSQFHDQFHNTGYIPQPVPAPTFEPPYMSQQQYPSAPQQPTLTHVTVSPPTLVRGSCPVCHGTSWTGSYSCCAWVLCIIFFPIGILCCLCMRKKKCTKCGFTLG